MAGVNGVVMFICRPNGNGDGEVTQQDVTGNVTFSILCTRMAQQGWVNEKSLHKVLSAPIN